MDKLIISFNGLSESEIENQATLLSVNWAALMPAIEGFVRLRPYEKINGLIINDTEIRVSIAQKSGRKATGKKAESISETQP